MAIKYLTSDLKKDIDENTKSIRALERRTDVHDEKLSHLREDVDENMDTTKELQKVVIASYQAINFGKWILGAFGLSMIALIWSLITGQATLLFK